MEPRVQRETSTLDTCAISCILCDLSLFLCMWLRTVRSYSMSYSSLFLAIGVWYLSTQEQNFSTFDQAMNLNLSRLISLTLYSIIYGVCGCHLFWIIAGSQDVGGYRWYFITLASPLLVNSRPTQGLCWVTSSICICNCNCACMLSLYFIRVRHLHHTNICSCREEPQSHTHCSHIYIII